MDNYTVFDVYSQHSIKQSTMTIKDVVKRASEAGAKAVALADMYSATGMIDFIKQCQKKGLKSIVGITLRYRPEINVPEGDIAVFAKNYEGYMDLCSLISDSYVAVEKGAEHPTIDKEILGKYGKNGNIFVTTSGLNGVLASLFFGNDEINEEIEALKKKIVNYNNPDDPAYIKNKELAEENNREIERLLKQREECSILSKKTYKKRKVALELLKGEEREAEEKRIMAEEAESEEAKKELDRINNAISRLRKKVSSVNAYIKQMEKTHKNYTGLDRQIKELEAKLVPDESRGIYINAICNELICLVGHDNFYLEIQFHRDERELPVMKELSALAIEKGYRLIAGQGARINSPEETGKYRFVRSMDLESRYEERESDGEYYIKNEESLKEILKEAVYDGAVALCMASLDEIGKTCNVVLPDTLHYPRFRDENGVPVADAKAMLRSKAEEGAGKLFEEGEFDEEYRKRMDYELSVICDLGYADYLLIVADFINYARDYAKKNNKDGIGYGIGPGRGSAAGSLVCYLLGITEINPMKYGLIFERFLNKDRVSMPDIDTDFSNEVRDAAIEYVKKKYGYDSVASIATITTQKARASVRNCTRTLAYYLYGNDAKTFYPEEHKTLTDLGDRISKSIPKGPDVVLGDSETELRDKFSEEKNAKEIIDKALETEGIITNTGVHAAGVIIGDGQPLREYVPLMYDAEDKKWATQCDKDQAEKDMKLLKMDFLGLINLDIITECIRRVKELYGVSIDVSRLPFEDEVFSEIFSKGNTGSVFQFESDGMKGMLRKFQPSCFEDIILLVAAYRPGPMSTIPDIISVKQGKTDPEYLVPGLNEILDKTYGHPIYQEQLMDICHKCAGFSLGKADIIRKAMSKKKVEEFLGYKDEFIDGIVKTSGAGKGNAEKLWDSLVNFAMYAFNKSHAAAYAYISYITAYLKYHYPSEYMCAVLNNAKIENIPQLLSECRNMGIKVLCPDVNLSNERFDVRGTDIVYGLSCIKTFQKAAADKIITERRENGKFKSFMDFLFRTGIGKTNTEKLIKCGAFDFFCKDREKLLSVLPDYSDAAGTVKDKRKILADEGSSQKKKDNAQAVIDSIIFEFGDVEIVPEKEEITDDMLDAEMDYLGGYISRHPLDSYKHIYTSGVTKIKDAEEGKNKRFAGIIKGFRTVKSKKTGKEHAFFMLEDPSGTIEVCCFSDYYKKYGDLLKENAVVIIDGKVVSDDNEEESEYKLIVSEVSTCTKSVGNIMAAFKSEDDKKRFEEMVGPYIDENGLNMYYYEMYGEASEYILVKQDYRVNAKVTRLSSDNIYVKRLKN